MSDEVATTKQALNNALQDVKAEQQKLSLLQQKHDSINSEMQAKHQECEQLMIQVKV